MVRPSQTSPVFSSGKSRERESIDVILMFVGHHRDVDETSGRPDDVRATAYAGYRALASKGGVTLAFCWRTCAERVFAEASPIRQERSRPLPAELEPCPREKVSLLSRKSKLAQATRYGLLHWEGLNRYLDDLAFKDTRRSTRPSFAISPAARSSPTSATSCWSADPSPSQSAHLTISLKVQG